jgi:hypothetical protein
MLNWMLPKGSGYEERVLKDNQVVERNSKQKRSSPACHYIPTPGLTEGR